MVIAMVIGVVFLQAAAEQKEKIEFLHKIDPDTGLTWLLVSSK